MTTHHDSTRWGIPVVYSPETPKLVADELSDEGQCFGVLFFYVFFRFFNGGSKLKHVDLCSMEDLPVDFRCAGDSPGKKTCASSLETAGSSFRNSCRWNGPSSEFHWGQLWDVLPCSWGPSSSLKSYGIVLWEKHVRNIVWISDLSFLFRLERRVSLWHLALQSHVLKIKKLGDFLVKLTPTSTESLRIIMGQP